MKIASWNLLHRSGGVVDRVSSFLEDVKPDLLLMQEATESVVRLSDRMSGSVYYHPWPGKSFGMAIWTKQEIEQQAPISLPYSTLPGSFPVRSAQIVKLKNTTITNVHLSHGQILNRRQLLKIARNTAGSTVIMGDFNAVGPTILKDFRDVGPRAPTHVAQSVLPFRLDRCLVRSLDCTDTEIHGWVDKSGHPPSCNGAGRGRSP